MEDAELKQKIGEWFSWSKNEKDNGEIQQLVAKQDVAELRTRLFNRMEFGTAGLMCIPAEDHTTGKGDGCLHNTAQQIITPIDKGISECILENLEPWETSWDTDFTGTSPLCVDPFDDIHTRYQNDVDANSHSSVKFTYTAMHGVGYPFTDFAVQQFGFPPVIPVPEQTLSMRTADQNGSTVILANDPDADRLAIAEKVSTVSSKILAAIAKKEGFHFEETLTGFKWMGNRANIVVQEGKTVLFAFEEAIGFMCGSTVLDKDGVSAAAVAAEMATNVYGNGKTLKDQLDEIYNMYGMHINSNSYYICHEAAAIKAMFEDIRNYNNTGKLLPVSKSSHMITFTFENGCVATLRTSGTEPKIKYYTEHRPDPAHGLTREAAEAELADIVQSIVTHFFRPEKNGFIPRKID
ncbi:PGM2L-like protein [Mya arenaria]|uniref:PGM2L-like protein n=1 Tax=Mya arenaria TaxID=6604 RepID=A0ABY7DRZ3_MYAAR|nr:PGM2L-like protein [Mya arenaria]